MKRIGADHIGFNEIGGAGEIVYRVVRFKTIVAMWMSRESRSFNL